MMGDQTYGVSACLLIKDENTYIEEWLDWHVSIGIEHFFIYDNESTVPISESIPDRHKIKCTVVCFPDTVGVTQIEAYTDCLSRFGALTRWLAFIDTDEFIRVVDGTNLGDFLGGFMDVDGLAVKWTVYNADGQMEKAPGPVRERFRTTVEYPVYLPQCKCIVDPKRVKRMAAHGPTSMGMTGPLIVNERKERIFNASDARITCDTIVVDHYFTRSYEEWLEKMARGSCDRTSIRRTAWFDLMNPGLREEAESK